LRLIGNFLWFIFNGLFFGLVWWIAATIFFISIIGAPWGRAAFNIGKLSFFPFGKDFISRKEISEKTDIGTGFFGVIGNVIWFLLVGAPVSILHCIWAIGCAVTIIGIPFSIQHLKIAGASLFPIGKTIVSTKLAKDVNK
jgi:uncharacterized membrane protein YccF (DUF307 family)